MNTNIENTTPDDARFDRLVDGQLSEPERRDLLASLDDEPGGWRRCALAFLEAQCWKQAIGSIARDDLAAVEPVSATVQSRSIRPGRLGTVLAMAASFALAMWLGWWVQHERAGNQIVQTGVGMNDLAGNIDFQPPPFGKLPEAESPSQPWRTVSMPTPGRDGRPGPSLNLPAVERDRLDSQWMQNLPPAIPDNVREAFVRTGHELKQRRELVPVRLDDGRQLVMPVDQVDVHYVGNGPY